MIFPLCGLDIFGPATGQVIGVLCGIAFGFVLERAGFGHASNLAAQFYGGDNRVLKVMFTGIATTTASLGLLAAFGLLDLGLVTVPETFLWPQLVGGLLLGVGFIVSGYCPGTGVVGAASGRIDGVLAYGGVMLGSLVFGWFYGPLEGFYHSGSMGSIRLDQWLGLSFPVVGFGVVMMAVGAFFGAERLEAWLARRRGTEAPDRAPLVRNLSLGGVVALGVLALLPSATPTAGATAREPQTLAPLDLAAALVTDERGLFVADLRDPAVCAIATVRGASCRPPDDPDAAFLADVPAHRTLVVVLEPGGTLPAVVGSRPDTWVLAGGYPAFVADVLTAPVLPAEPTLADIEGYQRRSALHGAFTGADAAPVAPVVVKKAAGGAPVKKGGGC